MAKAVDFRVYTPENSRNDLIRRLESAPDEHVEALLSMYELLQRAHDKGVIDIANGMLSAGGTVMEKMADVASSAEVINLLRLTFMMVNLVKAMDVDKMHGLLTGGDATKPPSLFELGKQAMSEDARLGMATGIGLLNVFGAALRKMSGGAHKESELNSLVKRFYDDVTAGKGVPNE